MKLNKKFHLLSVYFAFISGLLVGSPSAVLSQSFNHSKYDQFAPIPVAKAMEQPQWIKDMNRMGVQAYRDSMRVINQISFNKQMKESGETMKRVAKQNGYELHELFPYVPERSNVQYTNDCCCEPVRPVRMIGIQPLVPDAYVKIID